MGSLVAGREAHAFISDRTGEDQVWLVDQDGFKSPEQLTTTLQGMLFAPEWSPDGALLAFTDKDGRVFVLTVAEGKLDEVADDRRTLVNDIAWSPDSKFLAFSLSDDNQTRSLWIWSAADRQTRRASAPAPARGPSSAPDR